MKRVKFVESLNVKEVAVGSCVDMMRYATLEECAPIDGTDRILAPVKTNTRVVPIHQFCESGKPDIFIAYSKEVEELLGMPFNVLHNDLKEAKAYSERIKSSLSRFTLENDVLSKKLLQVNNASIWQRLKYLLTGKLP